MGWACWIGRLPRGLASTRAALSRWAKRVAVDPFHFLNAFLIQFLKQTYKFNMKICRSPKIVKPIFVRTLKSWPSR
jgi:hypothetical protein